jgi:hypothetical protein
MRARRWTLAVPRGVGHAATRLAGGSFAVRLAPIESAAGMSRMLGARERAAFLLEVVVRTDCGMHAR